MPHCVADPHGEAELAGRTIEPESRTREAEQAVSKVRRASSGPVNLTAGDQKWPLSPEEVGRVLSVSPSAGGIRVGVDRDRLRAGLSNVYGALEQKPVEVFEKAIEKAAEEADDG